MACQFVVQAIVYFVICVLNFLVAIPLGVTMVEFGNRCTLYNEFTWVNATHFEITFSSPANCTFPIYVPAVLIFYTLIIGIYYMDKVCWSNDQNFEDEMWMIPFIVLNTIIVFLMLVVCCMISVGLKISCDSFLEGQKFNSNIKKCADIETFASFTENIEPDHHFYTNLKLSEGTAWAACVIWIVQLTLCIVECRRNHRNR